MTNFTGGGIGENTNYKIGERDEIMKSVDNVIFFQLDMFN